MESQQLTPISEQQIQQPSPNVPVEPVKVNKTFKLPIILMVIVILISLATSGFFYYQKIMLEEKLNSNPVPEEQNINFSEELKYSLVDTCSAEQCLFEKEGIPEGLASLEGYYFNYEADDWGTPTTCDGFVVTNGNETLIKHFNTWIDDGNSLNKRIDGKLVVNISLENLDEETKNIIKNSNTDSNIELNVVRITPVGRSASTCSPVIDIVFATVAK